jgi:hypothetical protein
MMRVAVDRALRQAVLPRQETKRMTLCAILADPLELGVMADSAGLRHSFITSELEALPVPVPALISPVLAPATSRRASERGRRWAGSGRLALRIAVNRELEELGQFLDRDPAAPLPSRRPGPGRRDHLAKLLTDSEAEIVQVSADRLLKDRARRSVGARIRSGVCPQLVRKTQARALRL